MLCVETLMKWVWFWNRNKQKQVTQRKVPNVDEQVFKVLFNNRREEIQNVGT